jgi:hypothetical protein
MAGLTCNSKDTTIQLFSPLLTSPALLLLLVFFGITTAAPLVIIPVQTEKSSQPRSYAKLQFGGRISKDDDIRLYPG